MWGEIALMILLVLVGAAAGLSVRQRNRLKAWQEAAVSCGLQVLEVSSWQLKARAGPVEVRLEAVEKGLTRIVVVVPGPPNFHNVRIRRETPFQWVREIEIGDNSFDSMFRLEGPMRLVFALLDAETRRLLRRVYNWLEISNGALQAESLSNQQVHDVLPLLLAIGQRFAQVVVPRRLAENAKQDPVVAVRLQNLLVLIRELPGDPVTIEALRTACSDSSPEIRLRAAKELGAEGREVLLELAEGMEDDTFSALAVSALGGELTFERTAAILEHALSRRRVQTARACLEVLGRSSAAEAVDTLAKVMAQEKGGLAIAAAEALEMTGSPAAEPSLISALQREPSDLQVAAAKALGHIGSVAAVLPLKEARERSRLDLDLRRATRQAIAEIQSRVQGANPGQLSLAGAEAGQLSLAQAAAGQLSIATGSAGQLSLPPEEAGQLSLSGGEKGQDMD